MPPQSAPLNSTLEATPEKVVNRSGWTSVGVLHDQHGRRVGIVGHPPGISQGGRTPGARSPAASYRCRADRLRPRRADGRERLSALRAGSIRPSRPTGSVRYQRLTQTIGSWRPFRQRRYFATPYLPSPTSATTSGTSAERMKRTSTIRVRRLAGLADV